MSEHSFRIPIDELMPDPSQPRKIFLQADLNRLAASIAARGILQFIRARWDKEWDRWLILTGESRWRAAKLAGLTEVPVIPVEDDPSEADLLVDRLIENTMRSDLPPMQVAQGDRHTQDPQGLLLEDPSRRVRAFRGVDHQGRISAHSVPASPRDVGSTIDHRICGL